jgi:hypothetical protein
VSEIANHLKSNRDNITSRFNTLRSVKVGWVTIGRVWVQLLTLYLA